MSMWKSISCLLLFRSIMLWVVFSFKYLWNDPWANGIKDTLKFQEILYLKYLLSSKVGWNCSPSQTSFVVISLSRHNYGKHMVELKGGEHKQELWTVVRLYKEEWSKKYFLWVLLPYCWKKYSLKSNAIMFSKRCVKTVKCTDQYLQTANKWSCVTTKRHVTCGEKTPTPHSVSDPVIWRTDQEEHACL